MKIKHYSLIACLVALLIGCDNAPVPKQAITALSGYTDITGVKLETGKAAPDFNLQSLSGDWVNLSSLRGSRVLMIFYRGHWCPFCVGHLQDIQTLLPELEKLGYQVLAISPDDATDIQKMADRSALHYPGSHRRHSPSVPAAHAHVGARQRLPPDGRPML